MIRNLWYRLTCRFWHRFNVVVCKSIPSTWIDRDFLLLYAAFQILEDFVQKERGHFYEDVYADELAAIMRERQLEDFVVNERGHFYEDVYALYVEDCGVEEATQRELEWNKLRELYAWWNQRKHRFDDDCEEDNMRLHQLIDLRKMLWT